MPSPTPSLDRFRENLAVPDLLTQLRAGLIGEGMVFTTPFGEKPLLYADYVASGRALHQVEAFIVEHVLPYYSNTHTEASFCGQVIKHLREEGRQIIGELIHAGSDCHVIFSGSGATSGLNRLVNILDVPARLKRGEHIKVLIGPYEHHSNILPWRESGAEITQIPLDDNNRIDLDVLEAELLKSSEYDLVVGAFSAGSNVTGVLTDTDAITRKLKHHGAMAIFDYAAVAPYVEIDMGEGGAAKDAIVFSPHKFPGGPGASGILVVRDTLDINPRPSAPGGGTVTFVSPWKHLYSHNITAREEAGTPNVVGDIRAAMAMLVKEAVGIDQIERREQALRRKALATFAKFENMRLLSPSLNTEALPILSFQLKASDGNLINHQLVTRLLSDVFGIQARGGCACAGPYAHYLLGIDESLSERIVNELEQGNESAKPGWVRLNLSYLHTDEQVDYILSSLEKLSLNGEEWQSLYHVDKSTARFIFQGEEATLEDVWINEGA